MLDVLPDSRHCGHAVTASMPVWQANRSCAAGNPHMSSELAYVENRCIKSLAFTPAEALWHRLDGLYGAIRKVSLIFL